MTCSGAGRRSLIHIRKTSVSRDATARDCRCARAPQCPRSSSIYGRRHGSHSRRNSGRPARDSLIRARRGWWPQERGRRRTRHSIGRIGLRRGANPSDGRAFGAVAALVGFDGHGARFAARNTRLDTILLERVPEPFGVVAPVSQHPLRLSQVIEQGRCAPAPHL